MPSLGRKVCVMGSPRVEGGRSGGATQASQPKNLWEQAGDAIKNAFKPSAAGVRGGGKGAGGAPGTVAGNGGKSQPGVQSKNNAVRTGSTGHAQSREPARDADKSEAASKKGADNARSKAGAGASKKTKVDAQPPPRMCSAKDGPKGETIHSFDGKDRQASDGVFGLGKRRDNNFKLVQNEVKLAKPNARGETSRWEVRVQPVHEGRVNADINTFSSNRKVTVKDFNDNNTALTKNINDGVKRLNADGNRLAEPKKAEAPKQPDRWWIDQQARNVAGGVTSAANSVLSAVGSLPENTVKVGSSIGNSARTTANLLTGGRVGKTAFNPILTDRHSTYYNAPTHVEAGFNRSQAGINKTIGADADSFTYKASEFAAPMLLTRGNGKSSGALRGGAPTAGAPRQISAGQGEPVSLGAKPFRQMPQTPVKLNRSGSPSITPVSQSIRAQYKNITATTAPNGSVRLTQNGRPMTVDQVVNAVASRNMNQAHLKQAGFSDANIHNIMKQAAGKTASAGAGPMAQTAKPASGNTGTQPRQLAPAAHQPPMQFGSTTPSGSPGGAGSGNVGKPSTASNASPNGSSSGSTGSSTPSANTSSSVNPSTQPAAKPAANTPQPQPQAAKQPGANKPTVELAEPNVNQPLQGLSPGRAPSTTPVRATRNTPSNITPVSKTIRANHDAIKPVKTADGTLKLANPNGKPVTVTDVVNAVANGKLSPAQLKRAQLSEAAVNGVVKDAARQRAITVAAGSTTSNKAATEKPTAEANRNEINRHLDTIPELQQAIETSNSPAQIRRTNDSIKDMRDRGVITNSTQRSAISNGASRPAIDNLTVGIKMRNFGSNARAISDNKLFDNYLRTIHNVPVSKIVQASTHFLKDTRNATLPERSVQYRDVRSSQLPELPSGRSPQTNAFHDSIPHDVHTAFGAVSKVGETDANSVGFAEYMKKSWADRSYLPSQGPVRLGKVIDDMKMCLGFGRLVKNFGQAPASNHWNVDGPGDWKAAERALSSIETKLKNGNTSALADDVSFMMRGGFLPKGAKVATRLEQAQSNAATHTENPIATPISAKRLLNSPVRSRVDLLHQSLGTPATTYALTTRQTAAARYMNSIKQQPDAAFDANKFRKILAQVEKEAGPAEVTGPQWHKKKISAYTQDKDFSNAMKQSPAMAEAWRYYTKKYEIS
jgi:hypothetical protein